MLHGLCDLLVLFVRFGAGVVVVKLVVVVVLLSVIVRGAFVRGTNTSASSVLRPLRAMGSRKVSGVGTVYGSGGVLALMSECLGGESRRGCRGSLNPGGRGMHG